MIQNFNANSLVWFNGEFVTYERAMVHILSSGLHYAVSVFEGERSYNGKVFKIDEHRARFFRSAATLGINLPYSKEELNDAIYTLLRKEGLSYAYIRMIAFTNGDGDMTVGLAESSVHVAIAVWPWNSYFDPTKGISLFVSNWKRPAPSFIPQDIKASGMYMMSNIYKKDGVKNGYDDSLLCDFEGNIADTTCANIFFVKDGQIYTPSAQNFLHGITRNTILQKIHESGIPVHKANITIQDIDNFDEAFITGTAVEVTRVKQIGAKIFKSSEITDIMQNMYNDIVHSDK